MTRTILTQISQDREKMDVGWFHHHFLHWCCTFLPTYSVSLSEAAKILTTVANSPSNGLALIYSGRVVSGIGIGAISAVAPAFVSECSPKEVRGRITGLFQIMVAIGVMLSYFINCKSFWRANDIDIDGF